MRLLSLSLLATATLLPALSGGTPERGLGPLQQPNGSWVDYREVVVAERHTKRPESESRTTSIVLLAYLGGGSTIRSGPSRKRVRRAVMWLRKQIDTQGRIGRRSDPRRFTDHALASFTLCKAVCLSKYRALRRHVTATTKWLLRYLRDDRATVSAEFLFWCRALADSLQNCPKPVPSDWREEFVPLATQLLAQIERRATRETRRPATEIERALALYVLVHNGAESVSPRARRAIEATLARDKILTTMKPMAVALTTMAIYSGGGKSWKTWQRRVGTQIVRRQIEDGAAMQTWRAPRDSIGPVETTAWHALTLECYYGNLRLQLMQ